MRALRVTWATAFREAWADRRSFWVQTIVMILNDAVWVVFWVLFFRRVGEIRGWDIDQLIVLQAILTTSGGIVLGLLANSRSIGSLAADGGLDAVLALPVRPLPYLLVREVRPINIGDIIFGVSLFFVAAHPTPARVGAFVIGVSIATVLIVSFLVLVGSSAFHLGRNEAGELGFHAMMLFSAYPVDVFSGATKVLLYTVVPAGFVTAVPSRFVETLDMELALAAGSVAAAFAVAAVFAFDRGLRRYTSGAVWTSA